MDWLHHQVAPYAEAAREFFAFDTSLLSEPAIIAALCVQALLFILSAFFSGSETALFSLSRLDLQKLRRERHPRSETLHALLDQPRRRIISILCGNELVNIAATANLAGILVYLYGESRAGWINILIMFPLLLLLGEITPKTIAVSNPVQISAGLVAEPMSLWVRVITPLRRIVRLVSDAVTTWIVGKELARENILQVDELRTLLADVAEEGVLDATERVLIDNLLEAGETEIVEIMTPRTRVNFLKDDMALPEIVEAFQRYKHPRVPVCHEHHDALVGFIHAEDILRLTLDKADLNRLSLVDVMHPPVVVPPTKYVDEMFDFFQANNARAAVVLNEFGGVEGLITMRDIINFIFGEISEAVTGQELYQERDENDYEVPGDMKLTDFNDLTNFGVEDPRMTTIGGVVFRHLDRLPVVGDRVAMEGLVATVLEMEGHRLAKVRISKGVFDEREEAAEETLPIGDEEFDRETNADPDADEAGSAVIPGETELPSREVEPLHRRRSQVVEFGASVPKTADGCHPDPVDTDKAPSRGER
jgi:CBS domain containing-hemolysin-like protein